MSEKSRTLKDELIETEAYERSFETETEKQWREFGEAREELFRQLRETWLGKQLVRFIEWLGA